MNWNPIATVPKDGTEVILWDGDRIVTRGFFDEDVDDAGQLVFFWFDCLDPTYDLPGQFKYWIPMPGKDKTK